MNGVDGRGLLTSESYGVNAADQADWLSNNLYDSSGWLLAQCVSQGGYSCATSLPVGNSNQPLDERYRYDIYGNLKKQYHNGQWLAGGVASNTGTGSVSYTYDALHRVTKAVRTGASAPETVDYAYNDIGGLRKKTDYSSDIPDAYSYGGSNHQVNSVALKAGGTASYGYDANGNVQSRTEAGMPTLLQYDIANLPRKIVKGSTTADFYEAPGGRYLQRMVGGGVTRDTYSLEKTYEREVVGGNISVERYYLTSGSLLTIKSDGRKLNYLHTDRLGSPVTITEKVLPADGKLGTAPPTLVEHRGFDAFGKALDGQWGSSNLGMLNLTGGQAMNTGKRNQRGFTGHEHLDEFALIHMNGRAYDFNLGRFYGVDPFIQFPSNSQSLNPYAYLMNNPLAGTDPTGYLMEGSVCGVGPDWACRQEAGSKAYRSGYAYTPLWRQLTSRSNGATARLSDYLIAGLLRTRSGPEKIGSGVELSPWADQTGCHFCRYLDASAYIAADAAIGTVTSTTAATTTPASASIVSTSSALRTFLLGASRSISPLLLFAASGNALEDSGSCGPGSLCKEGITSASADKPQKIVTIESDNGDVSHIRTSSPERLTLGAGQRVAGSNTAETSKFADLKGPHRRHFLEGAFQGQVNKKMNTIIAPGVDYMSDVRMIRSGVIPLIGNQFDVNGRTWGHHNGSLYPISGSGFYQLNRGAYAALGVFNKFGNSTQTDRILGGMKTTPEDRASAMEVWSLGR